jgi:hypothetical protein
VPHLQKLSDAYRSRGFTVVAVSDETTSKIEPYLRQQGISYGVARAPGVLRTFGGDGYPSAWLIDASGRVVWEGHPMALSATTIEPLLGTAGAGPAGTVPGQASPGVEDSDWWIWLIAVPAILFAAAMGWFIWSSRDRTARQSHGAWYPPQPYPPQPGAPPPGAAPPGAGPPPATSSGLHPVQLPPQQAVAPQQPVVGQPFDNLGYSAPPPSYGPAQARVTGGAGRYGVDGLSESPGSATKRRERADESKPYLSDDPMQAPPMPPPPRPHPQPFASQRPMAPPPQRPYGQQPPHAPYPPQGQYGQPQYQPAAQPPYPQQFQQPLAPEPLDDEALAPEPFDDEPLTPENDFHGDEFPPYDTNQNRPGNRY